MRSLPWGDLLTAYNGAAISYDEIGNPDGYSDRTFTWEHGRQLATQTRNGVTWTYTYDANGMRTKRSSDSKTYEYVYLGDKLVQMTITDHTTSPETVQLMEFSYDAAGQPLTMTLDGVIYYYVLNIQGDVMGMVDGNGNLLLSFIYEGFGAGYYTVGTSDMETTLLSTNPLGYRGYVMDLGTALYYLQSRYYDPALGRFINADALVSTGQGMLGNNMFTYCLNNPIIHKDADGQDAIILLDENFPGHIGLLVQDEEGNWWHFYWGAASWLGYFLCVFDLNVKAKTWCKQYTGEITLTAINDSEQFSGDYESMTYLSDDYSSCVAAMKNVSGKYNLYSDNCSQVSFRILSTAETEYAELFAETSQKRIPAVAYGVFYICLTLDEIYAQLSNVE